MIGTRNYNRLAVVRVVLVEGTNLARIPQKQPNVYCSLQLGKQKEKSRTVSEYKNPVWRDAFEFYIYEGLHDELQITIKNQNPISLREGFTSNDDIGKVTIDLASLKHETTTDVWKDVFGKRGGKLHLLVTISGTTASDSPSNTQNVKNWDILTTNLTKQIQLPSSSSSGEYVGRLLIMVHKAEGLTELSGKSNPFCQIKIGGEVLRTQTQYKTVAPSWNKYFEFTIRDICDCIEITTFDEENDKKHGFLGRLKIPLLHIRNNERIWYSLKDNTLRILAGGDDPKILLEFFFAYNTGMMQ